MLINSALWTMSCYLLENILRKANNLKPHEYNCRVSAVTYWSICWRTLLYFWVHSVKNGEQMFQKKAWESQETVVSSIPREHRFKAADCLLISISLLLSVRCHSCMIWCRSGIPYLLPYPRLCRGLWLWRSCMSKVTDWQGGSHRLALCPFMRHKTLNVTPLHVVTMKMSYFTREGIHTKIAFRVQGENRCRNMVMLLQNKTWSELWSRFRVKT